MHHPPTTIINVWSAAPCAIFLSLLTPTLIEAAEGIRTLPDSAENMGKVGGHIANSSDPSVVSQNPANLTKFDAAAFQLNTAFWYGETDYTSPGGSTSKMEEPWKVLPSFYYVHPLHEDKIVAGMGVTAPFGLSIDWPRDGDFKYVLPFSNLVQTFDFRPAIAFKPVDRLSIGFGGDIMWSRLKLDQLFPFAAITGVPGTPDSEIEFEGDGWGFGGYAAMTWSPLANHRLSVVGRLPIQVDYDGDFRIHDIPPGLAGFSRHSSFDTAIEFPGSVGLGYGVDIGERISAGIDFEWLQNSTHDDLPLDIGENEALLPADRLVLDWRDSVTAGFGLEWRTRHGLTWRAGYKFSETPMPSRTFTPAVPANDRHIFGIGLGYETDRNSLQFAYSYIFFPDRTISDAIQPAFNGEYDFRWQTFTLSYTHRW